MPISSSLSSDLGSMVNSSVLSDLTVLTKTLPSPNHTHPSRDHTLPDEDWPSKETSLSAHRCFLAARCRGFREVIEEDAHPLPNVLDLSQFDRRTVLQFLELVYTGECQEAPDGEMEVIADRWKCDDDNNYE